MVFFGRLVHEGDQWYRPSRVHLLAEAPPRDSLVLNINAYRICPSRSDYPSSESSLQAWALLPDVWSPTAPCATTWMLFVSTSVVAYPLFPQSGITRYPHAFANAILFPRLKHSATHKGETCLAILSSPTMGSWRKELRSKRG